MKDQSQLGYTMHFQKIKLKKKNINNTCALITITKMQTSL